MKKITAPLIVLTGFIISLSLSCKKEKTKEPLCSWFPVMTGTSSSYTVTQQQGNTPPYPTYSKPYPTTDTSLSIYSLLFVFRDCASGQLLFDHGPSAERIVLFDKNRIGDSILITDVVFHNIRHFVTQTTSPDGKLSSTLKEEPAAHEELRAEFMPGVGIVYVAAINPTTGDIIYSVSK